ncbi:MAG: DUF4139 domain-containing protein [Planctomycetota bacterium]|nr:DUF4139 domain-containing protein [Planctomycetota bacterium]
MHGLNSFYFKALALVLGGCALLAAGEQQPAEAPSVKKVILYKHGMGYIERRGKVAGNVVVDLNFRADQMQDLLTSFFAVDLGGGKIAGVQYETRDPLSKQLEGIRIRVPENAALSQFLTQLKGAALTAKAAGETVKGRVLGVEPVTQVLDGKTLQAGFKLVLLTEGGAIRSLDLYGLSEFKLEDEALQRDLNRLLTISLDSQYTNRKKLSLVAQGEGERELRVGYLIEMPIWKASYRVILDKKDANVADDPALLQGWALAENTTEEDWAEVEIAFVAGNPLSYVMDLYSPFYVTRPRVPIPGLDRVAANWDATPEASILALDKDRAELEGEKAQDMAEAKRAMAPMERAQMSGRAAPAAPGAMPPAAKPALSDLLANSVSAAAKGVQVGELFSYEGQQKVSIKRGQAAMVPILSQKVKGKRLLYYKSAFSSRPANAYVLKNDTELTLEAGAVTFFEGDTALGEGILSHILAPGGKEVLPYAIDGSVDVTPEVQNERLPAFKGVVANGYATLTLSEKLRSAWKLTNRGKSPATLWIDQPKHPEFKLAKPEKPLEEVESHYRFEVGLKASSQQEFVVEEQREVNESIYLTNSNEGQIRFLLSQAFFSDATKAFLKEVMALKDQHAAKQAEIAAINRQVTQLDQEQNRLRNNMNSLRNDRPQEQELRAKWVTRLGQAEDEILALRTKAEAAQAELQKQALELAEKIRSYKGE